MAATAPIAMAWALKAMVPTATTAANKPSSSFHLTINPITPAITEKMPLIAEAIGGTIAKKKSMMSLTMGLISLNMSTAACWMLPAKVENFPLIVWLSLSLIPSKAPPVLVA